MTLTRDNIEDSLRQGYTNDGDPLSIDLARAFIAQQFGGEIMHTNNAGTIWQFPGTYKADFCRAILNAITPGITGEVFGPARLYIGRTND